MEENKILSPNYELLRNLSSTKYKVSMFNSYVPCDRSFKHIIGSYYFDEETNVMLKKCKLIYNRYASKSEGFSRQKPHWSIKTSEGKTASSWDVGSKLHQAWLSNDDVFMTHYVWARDCLFIIIKPARMADDPYYKLTVDGKSVVRHLSSWLADAH